ncbi:MAG TPA: membrane protein insertion efficiency factor YidD [Thermoanaerobaculia bacterium]|nr:membrane protein insertion efficiency factor YidD [Thermoanaerobaculia bacterium]
MKRWRWRLAGLALLLLLAGDFARAPSRQLSARALVMAIHGYQATLSPAMPHLGVRCRFQPSCSRYAAGAIRRHGALGGSLRVGWRVARCGPWTPAGTVDPP